MAATGPIDASVHTTSPPQRAASPPDSTAKATESPLLIVQQNLQQNLQQNFAEHSTESVIPCNLDFWQWRYEPFIPRCLSNLAAMLSAADIKLPRDAWARAPLLRSAYFPRRFSPSRFAVSTALHGALAMVGVLWPQLADWHQPPHQPSVKELLDTHSVLYYPNDYKQANLLPEIAPTPAPTAAAPVENRAANIPAAPSSDSPRVKLSPARTAQPIASQQPRRDNRRQTIVQPDAPNIRIVADVRVPNILAVRHEMPAPAPPVPNFGQQRIRNMSLPPRPQPEPVAPPPPPQRKADPAAPSLQAVNIRAASVDINPIPPSANEVPAFPVPVTIRRPVTPAPDPAPRRVRQGDAARPLPDAPAVTTDASNAGGISLPTLIAASVNPPPPADEVKIPVGNRSGVFTATPDGVWTQGGGVPEGAELGMPWSDDVSGGQPRQAEVNVPGLAVSGKREVDLQLPIVQRNAAPDQKQLLASLSRPTTRPGISLPGRPAEDEFFGRRRVYTARVNMPNLTSRTGSWVLRFAEPEGGGPGKSTATRGELSTPQVLRKADPAYIADAQREHVEGVVLLAALVLRDGSIANIRVVRGLDQRLDMSAVSALTQWKFQPAMRDGQPVELEVLVQIPFAAQ